MKINRQRKFCQGFRKYATAFPNVLRACRTLRLAHQAFGAVMKVTPEVVERIMRLRRLGRRVADIAQLCGLSEPTVRKVLSGTTTKNLPPKFKKPGPEIDRED